MIEKYAIGLDAIKLKSHLEQLKDIAIPSKSRIVSSQVIVSFLYKLLHKLGRSVVMDYLNHLRDLASERVS